MKCILSYALLIVLFGGTSIWAYNNILDNHDTVRSKWGKRESIESNFTFSRHRITDGVDF